MSKPHMILDQSLPFSIQAFALLQQYFPVLLKELRIIGLRVALIEQHHRVFSYKLKS